MDNKEALEIIKKRIDELADVRAIYDSRSEAYKIINDEIKALLKACEALELEDAVNDFCTPKKFKKTYDPVDYRVIRICPRCSYDLRSCLLSNCCPNCGQAIDWSEVWEHEHI